MPAAAADEALHTVVRDESGRVEPADVVDTLRPAVRVYRDRDGLPQNSAMALAFGGDGSLWVGTQDGIVSFDGTSWSPSALPRPEVSSFVRAMLVDHDGALWVGRRDGALSRLAGGAWTTFDAAEGLPAPRVDSLVEVTGPGGGHTLWAGTRGGLARFEGGAWRPFEDNAALPSPHVTRILEGTDDDGAKILWVGTDAGLAKVRGARASAVEGAPRGEVHALLETIAADGTPTLWAGSTQSPLGRRTRGVWTWTGPPALPRADVWSLAETVSADGARVVWVGTDDGSCGSSTGAGSRCPTCCRRASPGRWRRSRPPGRQPRAGDGAHRRRHAGQPVAPLGDLLERGYVVKVATHGRRALGMSGTRSGRTRLGRARDHAPERA